MSREVVWTKAVVDAFVAEACLSDEEELIIRSRAKGWTRTKQSMQYNMSIRKIDYIIHTLKTKYISIHAPPRGATDFKRLRRYCAG